MMLTTEQLNQIIGYLQDYCDDLYGEEVGDVEREEYIADTTESIERLLLAVKAAYFYQQRKEEE